MTPQALILSLTVLATQPSFAQSILTFQELEDVLAECDSELVCEFEQLSMAMPPSDEIFSKSMGSIEAVYLRTGILAAIQAGGRDAVQIMDEILAYSDANPGKHGRNLVHSQMIHLYRAEACEDSGDRICFEESASLILKQEIRDHTSAFLFAGLQRPEKWSEIKEFQSTNASYRVPSPSPYADWARMLEGKDPKGINFHARIDSVLTFAELGGN